MRKQISILALSLITSLGLFAQGVESSLTKEVGVKQGVEEVKRPRFSFFSADIGGSIFILDDAIYGFGGRAVDINIAPKFAHNFGLRGMWGGEIYSDWYLGIEHFFFGPSYSFQTGNSIGTASILLGGLNATLRCCVPSPEYNVSSSKDWDFAYGLSYKHRFFTQSWFNLSLGVDTFLVDGGFFLTPSIGFAISW